MGLFRRGPTRTMVVERTTRARPGSAPTEGPGVHVLKSGADGKIHEDCWFCREDIAWEKGKGDPACALIIAPLEPGGEPTEAVCHAACADRAKGSLAKF